MDRGERDAGHARRAVLEARAKYLGTLQRSNNVGRQKWTAITIIIINNAAEGETASRVDIS